MGNCQRRREQEDAWREADGWELLPAAAEAAEEQVHAGAEAAAQEEQEAQAAPLVAQLDAATSVRRLPARRRPGSAAPSSHEAALAALRYRFGCRMHYIHVLKVQASQMGPVQWGVKLALMALYCLARRKHLEDDKLLKELKWQREHRG